MFKRFLGGKKGASATRLLVIGLDCAPPELIFDRWRDELPHLKRLMAGGVYRPFISSTPAITIPAWSSMTSSKDPGVLGFYGFRNRSDYSYRNRYIANSLSVKEPRIWDLLGAAGKQSIVVGVPQTYPIRPINGYLISSFLTPSTTDPQVQWTHPAALRAEVEALLAPEVYDVDVPHFRTDDKEYLLTQIYAMTRKRFKVLRHLMVEKPWDFFMFVEMGVDRIHHGFWAHHDPTHPKHDAHSPYIHAIRDYYHYLDGEIGSLLALLLQGTHVMVVSDHGVQPMVGGVCINQWLYQAGYLALVRPPEAGKITSIDKAEIDWSRTTAWGDGGYYARICLNVAGREPQGIVPAAEYEAVRDRLAAHISSIPDPQGQPLGTVIFKPQQIYREVRNFAPDLIVYLGNLSWRSIGGLGYESIYTFDNDTGPDDANHATNGIFIYTPPARNLGGRQLPAAQLMDFAPTVLRLFDLPVPADMQGQAMEN
ncbi:MAG: phosphodiesterase [Chloroflexi bacterium]|nr:phosphodiesterase [Chloroflexota bacterium]